MTGGRGAALAMAATIALAACSPAPEPVGLGRREGQLDTAHRPPGGRDRRIGVRDELRDDLDEVDTALREVLAEVAAAHPAVADGAWVEHHGGMVHG